MTGGHGRKNERLVCRPVAAAGADGARAGARRIYAAFEFISHFQSSFNSAMTRTTTFTLSSALLYATVAATGGDFACLHSISCPGPAVSGKKQTKTSTSNDDQDSSACVVLNMYLLDIRGGSASPSDNYDPAIWERFVRATKGDEALAQRRYQETEAWRKNNGIDVLLSEPHPQFTTIKQHYPHYYHGRGKRGEPVYYELPAQINLKELKRSGIDLSSLLRHYLLVTDFCWTVLERVQHGPQSQSIYVLDLEGIKLKDFVGDVAKFVKEAASLTSQHYPE